jgi:drug/metabolite transporter (DMT)-like permease
MAVLLAALSSVLFGAADFMGGVAARRAPAVSIVFASQLAGLAVVAVSIPVFGGEARPADLLWGAAAGVSGAWALAAFYHGLATTRVAVIAPVAAVVGTMLPVLFGLWTGERPAAAAWVGVAVAFPAFPLLGAGHGTAGRATARRAAVLGIVVGIGFGLFAIFLSRSDPASGMWPLAPARVASLAAIAVGAPLLGAPLLPQAGILRFAALIGVIDMSANILFLLAVRRGLLSLVSVVIALYPAVTVLGARLVFREPIHRPQIAGLALAAVSVTLIAAGSPAGV